MVQILRLVPSSPNTPGAAAHEWMCYNSEGFHIQGCGHWLLDDPWGNAEALHLKKLKHKQLYSTSIFLYMWAQSKGREVYAWWIRCTAHVDMWACVSVLQHLATHPCCLVAFIPAICFFFNSKPCQKMCSAIPVIPVCFCVLRLFLSHHNNQSFFVFLNWENTSSFTNIALYRFLFQSRDFI